jgi:hypothetical protein
MPHAGIVSEMRRPEVNPPFKFQLSDIVRRLKLCLAKITTRSVS